MTYVIEVTIKTAISVEADNEEQAKGIAYERAFTEQPDSCDAVIVGAIMH